MVIYADVLLIINLYINYFLVRGASVVLRKKPDTLRCLAAAATGAMGSLIILAPELPFWAVALIKIAVGTAVVIVAFGLQKRIEFVMDLLCFLIISFIFAGLMFALWWFAAPFDMVLKNGSAYFNIPLIWLAVLTMAAYGITLVIRRISLRNSGRRGILPVKIRLGSKVCELSGLADTGCRLRDVFSGTPVMVCSAKAIAEILPQNVAQYLAGNEVEAIRLVPCRTVCAEGLIPVFGADEIYIGGKKADILVGVSAENLGEYGCVFNPEMI